MNRPGRPPHPECALGKTGRMAILESIPLKTMNPSLLPHRKFPVAALSAALISLIACGAGNGQTQEHPVVRWAGQAMGSPYTIQIVDAVMDEKQMLALKTEVEARIKEINNQISHYQPDSELSKFNHAPANTPFKVSPGFAKIVRFSIELNKQSEGAFDPTISPVINLWGFGEKTEQHAIPSDEALKEALTHTGFKHLSINDKDELVKDIPELSINLSSPAKGFVSDEIVSLLAGHGYKNVYVAMAGDVAVRGHNPKGGKWNLGIATPMEHWKENNPMATVVALSDQAISTSGDNQKFFTDSKGRRLGHIFDPKTGWPVQHNVASVSVVAPNSMTAGATATTLFVLGQEAGLKYIEAHPDSAALFIVREADGSFRQVPSSRFAALTGWKP